MKETIKQVQTLIFRDGQLFEVATKGQKLEVFFNERQLQAIKKGLKIGSIKEGQLIQPLGDKYIQVIDVEIK